MPLSSLPNELLCLLPFYIDNIETFTNAASSCRLLYNAFSTAPPNLILQLAASSAPTFFSPHPHFLIAATARKASTWALGNEARTRLLRTALQNGLDGLYQFCLDHSSLTLADIRRTHLARFSTINPLSDLIDKMAGNQWYATPDFWDGGVSEPYTIDTDCNRATMQMIIYGELFGPSMEAFLRPEESLPFFDVHTRLDYFTYCVPDWVCRTYPGYEVLPTGPYAPGLESPREGDQVALHHILRCGRWRRMWEGAIRGVLGEEEVQFAAEAEDEDWRVKLLWDALQCQGIEGMQLVTMPVEKVEKGYLERVRRVKALIDALGEKPAVYGLGKRASTVVFAAPDPSNEIEVPCSDMWGPWG